MALNPQLFQNGMPIPFTNEILVLVRDGVEFEVDKIPGSNGGRVKARGAIYLSNIRMVFVATHPDGNFFAFDMPLFPYSPWVEDLDNVNEGSPVLKPKALVGLSQNLAFLLRFLYVHDEKFNQPIFHCNNISGHVEPVVPENEHRALYSTHSFKILFKEGGCGTFVPLFLNLISSVRQYNQQVNPGPEPRMDPLQAAQTPVDEMMRHAYIDPNDPTRIFLQQPDTQSQLRRRTYQSQPVEGSM
ncbi:hypothetical protein QQP08_015540 [Theobroma cacao]|nr:hypothetical protein QQP08_015540 [Theobroma cacao]